MSLQLPSTTRSRRLRLTAAGALLTVGLVAGCAQEEPLEPTRTTESAPSTSAPTSDAAPTTETAPTTADAAPTTTAPDDASATTQPPGDVAGPTDAPAEPLTLTGADKDFTVEIAPGWEDAIDLVDVESVQLAAKAPEQVDGYFMNVLVTKEEYVRNLTSAVEQAAEELAGDDAEYEILDPAPVDGNQAPGYTIIREVQDKTLAQTQRWISHDGTLYVVTLSALESQSEEAAEVLDDFLASWTWQD